VHLSGGESAGIDRKGQQAQKMRKIQKTKTTQEVRIEPDRKKEGNIANKDWTVGCPRLNFSRGFLERGLKNWSELVERIENTTNAKNGTKRQRRQDTICGGGGDCGQESGEEGKGRNPRRNVQANHMRKGAEEAEEVD
jgi:hypothetical protein